MFYILFFGVFIMFFILEGLIPSFVQKQEIIQSAVLVKTKCILNI